MVVVVAVVLQVSVGVVESWRWWCGKLWGTCGAICWGCGVEGIEAVASCGSWGAGGGGGEGGANFQGGTGEGPRATHTSIVQQRLALGPVVTGTSSWPDLPAGLWNVPSQEVHTVQAWLHAVALLCSRDLLTPTGPVPQPKWGGLGGRGECGGWQLETSLSERSYPKS